MAYNSPGSDIASITVTVASASTSPRAITIQCLDAAGNDIDYVATLEIAMFLNNARTAFVVTGGSTGLAIGTDGALLPVVAKKYFLATTEADGDLDLTYTDTGTEAGFIGVRAPGGEWFMGDRAVTIGT